MYREGRYVPDAFEEAVRRTLYIYLNLLTAEYKSSQNGLTDNEVIADRVIAGHYHPAFGSIVKSWAFRLAILKKMKELPVKGSVKVLLNNRDIPHFSATSARIWRGSKKKASKSPGRRGRWNRASL